jgi:hypothetical protein
MHEMIIGLRGEVLTYDLFINLFTKVVIGLVPQPKTWS